MSCHGEIGPVGPPKETKKLKVYKNNKNSRKKIRYANVNGVPRSIIEYAVDAISLIVVIVASKFLTADDVDAVHKLRYIFREIYNFNKIVIFSAFPIFHQE
jgi:hypothetical protein